MSPLPANRVLMRLFTELKAMWFTKSWISSVEWLAEPSAIAYALQRAVPLHQRTFGGSSH